MNDDIKKIVINFENKKDFDKFLTICYDSIKSEKGDIIEFEEEIHINIINLD